MEITHQVCECVGWYDSEWWRETYEMVCRGSDAFWKRRGIPEPHWQYWPSDTETFSYDYDEE